MLKKIKKMIFFKRTANFAMSEFGINLVKADRFLGGALSKNIDAAIENKFTVEETASICVISTSLAVAMSVDLEGQKPDYSKMHDIERKIIYLHAYGKIREEILDRLDISIGECYSVLEERSGIPNEYPE